jgi:glutathione S-transferase
LKFYKDFNKEGITNKSVIQSALKFKKVYDGFESNLTKQPYFLGKELSLLDIAWFIYTHRLILSGYPFKKTHPKVVNWYQNLLKREEFKKEVNESLILRNVRRLTRFQDAIKGTTLRKIVNF